MPRKHLNKMSSVIAGITVGQIQKMTLKELRFFAVDYGTLVGMKRHKYDPPISMNQASHHYTFDTEGLERIELFYDMISYNLPCVGALIYMAGLVISKH